LDQAAESGDKQAQQETGFQIALELMEKLRTTSGIHGLHIMAMHWEEVVPRLVHSFAEQPQLSAVIAGSAI